jgi:2-aminoadipate transaminase
MTTATTSPTTPRFARRMRGVSDELASILSLAAGSEDLISFAGGLPDPHTFPVGVLEELCGELLGQNAAVALQYSPTPGLPGLREAFAEHLSTTDGRRPEWDELMVTSGTIDAIGLLSKALLDPDDVVAVESPTYLGALDAFRGFEAEVRGIPMDSDGMDVGALERLCAARAPKLLYTVPDHQNPTGITMSEERRRRVLDVCRAYGALVLEDVAYRELTFTTTRPQSLWSLAPDVVVQAGTTSKTFFPGVRLGWAVGPGTVICAMTLAKQNSDQCAGSFGQRLLEEYLRGGHLEPQLQRSRALYKRRCDLMLDALQQHMPDGVTWSRPGGGFFVWLTLPAHIDTVALARRARDAGVAFVPGRPFHPHGDGLNTMRLAFSLADDDLIAEGVSRLGALVRSATEGA